MTLNLGKWGDVLAVVSAIAAAVLFISRQGQIAEVLKAQVEARLAAQAVADTATRSSLSELRDRQEKLSLRVFTLESNLVRAEAEIASVRRECALRNSGSAQ